jgi:AraC family transcriptional regulator of adaptative response/methylated-DNA-[protein]-cysteine methyltransferase
MSVITFNQAAEDYARIEQAILFLEGNFRHQPDLKTIAGSIGLSEHHFQRLFSRWAGISPKRFLQCLTLEYAKGRLEQAESVLDASYEAGLSGPGRLHDLFVTYEAMTPGEYKRQGEGLVIRYGFHASPFGECLLAVTERGICGLEFIGQAGRQQTLSELTARWPLANFIRDEETTRPLVETVFAEHGPSQPLKLLMMGTPFQLKVWQALLKIPAGTLVSYEDVATLIDRPTAARAVGNAVARNPIGYIIPCHRVIRKMGLPGPYHWGQTRKKAIIGWEATRAA